MSSPVIFPDIEADIIGYLAGELDATVAASWPQPLAEQLPAVAVTRSGGGTHTRLVLDEPTLDIDVLAATKAAAHDLAQQVRAQLFAAEATTQGGCRIHRVQDVSLIWLPHLAADGTDPIARYVLVMSLRIRPA